MKQLLLLLLVLHLAGCGGGGGTPDQQMKQALKLHEAGKLEEAVAGYQQVLSQEKDHVAALFNLGLIAQQKGEFAEAVDLFSVALSFAPEDPGILLERGYSYLATGELDLALGDADRARELDPESAETLVLSGEIHFARGEVTEALQQLTEAQWLDPDVPGVYAARAEAWEKQGETEMASLDRYLQELTEGMTETPLENRTERARFFLLLDQPQLAEIDLELALEQDPEFGTALFLRSDLLVSQGEQGDALDLLKTLRSHSNPAIAARALTREAEMYRKAGAAEQALATLEDVPALQQNPLVLSRKAWYLACLPQESLRNEKEALRIVETALERVEQDEEDVVAAYAAALAANGRFEEAVEIQQQVLGMSVDPEAPERTEALTAFLQERPYRISE